MKQYNNHLQAKVGERNNVNRQAMALLPGILDALRPLVGTKVLNQGAVISQKLRNVLPKFSDTPALSVYYSASRYSFTVTFRTSGIFPGHYPDSQIACYAECSLHLGDIGQNSFILEKVNDTLPNLRTDYTVEEVQQARQDLSAAMDAKHSAERKLCFFGEHDNH
jgi:hypothetical protein